MWGVWVVFKPPYMNKIQVSKKFILVLIALLCSLVRMGLRIAFRGGVGSAAPSELSLCFAYVYPGFHFGLCPHYTLGFEEVSCLRHSILPSPNQSHTITHIKNRIIHPFKIQRHTYWNLTMHTFKLKNIHYSKLNGTHIQIEQYTHSKSNDIPIEI